MTDSRTVPHPRSHESRRGIVLLIIGLVLAMLLAALSQTVLSAAMPTMVGELGGVDQMLWVMTAFMLASTITMPIYGKMSDLIGRKGPMIFAIIAFIFGSVIGALAPDMGVLIAGRIVQGLGGGGLIILSHAIIADVVPVRERGKYMGIMGAVFAVASVAGPLLGGWLTEEVGWRWTFWLNVPLGALALLAAITLLHLPKGISSRPKIDVYGIMTLAGAMACLILVASWAGNDYEWTSPVILSLIAATAVLAMLFVLIEGRATEPIIPPALFRDRNFNLTTAASLLVGVTMFGAMGYLPTYLQMTFGADATSTGLLMVPMMAMMIVASLLSGWLVSKYGRYKWMPITGAAFIAIALVLLGTMTPETPLWWFCVEIGLLGWGLGVNLQILLLIVQNSFPDRVVGTATAANTFFRQIGASLGSAVIGSLFALRLIDIMRERLPSDAEPRVGDISSLTPQVVLELPAPVRDIVVHGYNDALTPLMLWMAPLALIALVLLCFVKEVPLKTTIERDLVPDALSAGAADDRK
ncbi:drug resistance MFS transporter, drug:H+ antiporter-1 family protein [Pseudarthrobacter siccitolerans]|uniref:Drug resistance MFS transporter, drug:H+ antiporter-1 family protein n=1 Tax=Pseudarthrobacter siccitolerans TaxID=861266 RepID=A0A024GX58_9MICC|nr:MDR family MFS transporter [Pseudarthrobacter siccitolerans]CCQ44217.1 drug resistance MFS transporter, drug:H+ antiporter-1 family protein [Pseudarthrobacter siccitolerans]